MKRAFKILRARLALTLEYGSKPRIWVTVVLTIAGMFALLLGISLVVVAIYEVRYLSMWTESTKQAIGLGLVVILAGMVVMVITEYTNPSSDTKEEYRQPLSVYPELEPLNEVIDALKREVLNYQVMDDDRYSDKAMMENTKNIISPIYELNKIIHQINGSNRYGVTRRYNEIKTYEQLLGRRQMLLIIIQLLDTPELKKRLSGLKLMQDDSRNISDVDTKTQVEFVKPFVRLMQEIEGLTDKSNYLEFVQKYGLDANKMPEDLMTTEVEEMTTEGIMRKSMG